MSKIPQPLLAFDPDGVHAALADVYHVAAWPVSVWICVGFRYDGASIPRLLQPLIGGPWASVRLPAATVHDWLYASHAVWRWIADLIFLYLLILNGMPVRRALVDWWAVARFGGQAWRSHGPAENVAARDCGSIAIFGIAI